MIFVPMLKLTAYTWLSKLLTAGANFGTIIIISQLLGAEDRGVCAWYAFVIAISLLISEIAAGGTVVYLMQFYSWQYIRKLYVVWASLVSVCTVLVAGSITGISVLEMILLVLAACCNALMSFHNHVLLGKGWYTAFNGFSVAGALGIAFFTGATLWLKMGKWGYLWGMLVVWFTLVMVQYKVLVQEEKVQQHQQDTLSWKALVKTIFRTGFINQIVQLVGMANNRLPFFFLSPMMLGTYSNSLAIAEAMMLLPGSVGQVQYSKTAGRQVQIASYKAFAKMLTIGTLLVGLAAVFIQFLPVQVYTWLFGADFFLVGKYVKILSVSMIFYSMYIMLSYWQSASGKFMVNLWCTLASFGTTLLYAFVAYTSTGMWQVEFLVAAVSAGLVISGLAALSFFVVGWRKAAQTQK